jgi:hypothetical protein
MDPYTLLLYTVNTSNLQSLIHINITEATMDTPPPSAALASTLPTPVSISISQLKTKPNTPATSRRSNLKRKDFINNEKCVLAPKFTGSAHSATVTKSSPPSTRSRPACNSIAATTSIASRDTVALSTRSPKAGKGRARVVGAPVRRGRWVGEGR